MKILKRLPHLIIAAAIIITAVFFAVSLLLPPPPLTDDRPAAVGLWGYGVMATLFLLFVAAVAVYRWEKRPSDDEPMQAAAAGAAGQSGPASAAVRADLEAQRNAVALEQSGQAQRRAPVALDVEPLTRHSARPAVRFGRRPRRPASDDGGDGYRPIIYQGKWSND